MSKRMIFAMLILGILFSIQVNAQQNKLVAEQITKDNASTRLFSGSDAVGGIGDFYISNGIVQAVIDNAAFNTDLAALGVNRPNQNIVAPTGGNLIDLGTVGKNNDQFNLMFQVSNIDPNNAFFYTGVTSAVTAQQATITASGILLFTGVSTLPGSGPGPTLQAQTVYSLGPNDRFLTVTSTVVNVGTTAAPVFNITDAIPLIGRGTPPFVAFPGRGFNNPQLSLSPTGIAAALGIFPFLGLPGNIRPSDGLMDTVNNVPTDEVSYALAPVSMVIDPDGPTGPMAPVVTPLSAFLGITSGLVSAAGNPFDPTKSPMIPPGGTITYVRRIYVAEHNDIASTSDMAYKNLFPAAALGTLTGDVDGADNANVEASILFQGKLTPLFGDNPVPVTQVQTDSTGKFSVTLPAGDYTLTLISPERNDMTNVKVTVAPGTTTTAQIPKMSSVGQLTYTISEKGNAIPAKLSFIGLEGTKNPDFSRYFDAFVFDPKTNQVTDDYQISSYGNTPALNFLFTTDGKGTQALKPGKYMVVASRGVEYNIAMQTITVTAGQETKMDFQLERVVDTTGYVSSDFHVHSGRSNDASVPVEGRIRSFASENVEVLVSTDHNFISDFGPVVTKLGLNKFMKTIVGDELTTSLPNPAFPMSVGHHIAFPLLVKPMEARRGAPYIEYVSPATFYDRAKANNPGVKEIIQLNHPRAGIAGLTSIGLFNITGFNPNNKVPPFFLFGSQLNTSTLNIDFDAMELYNGRTIGEYQQVRNDWISLLNQGFVKTATAVSDSHRAVIETPGFPASYVASPTDDPTQVKDEMITKSIADRNLVGTSGPFIRADINGSPVGSLVNIKKTKKKATLNIKVTAPAWVPVDEVRVYSNGQLLMTFDATTNPKVNPAPSDPTSNQGVERFNAAIKLKLAKKDSFITVEAGTKLPAAMDLNGDGVIDTGDTNGDGKIDGNDSGLVQPPSPPIYNIIAPGFVPLAFTNPIFIDRNNNGKFDAPGLNANLVPTPAKAIQLNTIDQEYYKDSSVEFYPWYRLQIGADEMNNFFKNLPEVTRKLAKPQSEE